MKTQANTSPTCWLMILFMMIGFSVNAQENYEPGYVISQSGDTLFGYIDYRNWEASPEKIGFVLMPGGDKNYYSPVNIRQFGVHNEIYISAEVEIEISRDITADLEEFAPVKLRTERGFLQALVLGPKSLFFYKNLADKAQYYIWQNGAYELLVYKRYLLRQDESTSIQVNRKYIAQLALYFQDCPGMKTLPDDLAYNEKNLTQVFTDYYACVDQQAGYEKKADKLGVEFGLVAGVSFTNLKFKGDPDYLPGTDYTQSVNFVAGISLNLVLPRNQQRWSVFNDLSYVAFEVSGQVVEYTNPQRYITTATTIGYNSLKLTDLLRYTFPVGKASIFVNAGFSNSIAIQATNEKTTVSMFYGTETIDHGKAVEKSRKHEQSLVFGLGSRYKNWSVEYRLERGNGMSSSVGLSSATTRNVLVAGFRFR
ncbi:MAG: PorT family protein [Bacteroidetes bacterium]|nr:PorT family protein [Bacteroidota bacterium]